MLIDWNIELHDSKWSHIPFGNFLILLSISITFYLYSVKLDIHFWHHIKLNFLLKYLFNETVLIVKKKERKKKKLWIVVFIKRLLTHTK